MPIRGIVLGLGLMFVVLAWWRVLQRRARATGTVTRRPLPHERSQTSASTEITFSIRGQSYTFRPTVVTNFDAGRLEVGAKVAVAYDPSDPSSADIAETWRMYSGPVIATVLYLAFAYYAFLGGGIPGVTRP